MGTYRVSDFRGRAEDDDGAIRACLDAAGNDPSRTVVFDGEDYRIGAAILLPAHTTVLIDGCTIRQKDGTFDNVFRGANVIPDPEEPPGLPLDVLPTEDIRILGRNGAAIEGPDVNPVCFHPHFGQTQTMVGDFFGWRTLQICLSRCDGFEVSGLRLTKTRCWALSFDLCQSGYIHDLSIVSSVKNGDGIDLRSGCRQIRVEDITGDCSDDTVALTALRGGEAGAANDGRYLYPLEPTACLPHKSGEERDISQITVRNIRTGGQHHGIICLAANGCKVHDVLIENVEEIPTAAEPPYREATVKIYTGYGRAAAEGDIRDLVVRNVRGLYASSAVYSNARVKNVLLEGISHPLGREVVLDHPEGFTVR